MTAVVALGDSLTCGQGVGVQVPREQTWPALLTGALPEGRLLPLAVAGARVRDVRRRQVPSAAGGEIATVLAGLNDVARSGFEPRNVRTDLLAIVHELTVGGTTVLLGRLHDPTAMLPLPRPLRRLVRARVSEVNAAVDEAARYPRVHILDLAEVPALTTAGGWAVDRVHPSTAGHEAMAVAATEVLRRAGWTVAGLAVPQVPPAASGAARAWWVAAHGMPYLAGHLREIGGPVVTGLVRRS